MARNPTMSYRQIMQRVDTTTIGIWAAVVLGYLVYNLLVVKKLDITALLANLM
jgi:hypothetical protein